MSNDLSIHERAGLEIARHAVPLIKQMPDEMRAAAFELLSKITPYAEAGQFTIAATAVRAAREAQLLLLEILTPQ